MSRRTVFWSIAGALAAHAVLAGILVSSGVVTWSNASRTERTARSRGVEVSASVADDGTVTKVDESELATQLETGLSEIEQMSPQEREARFRESAIWIERHSSAQSIGEIGQLLRSAGGARRDRAYRPAESPPAGSFDFDSALFYSVIRKRGDDGGSEAFYVLVDQAGRTMQVPVPPGDERTAAIIEKMHSSPLLRELWHNIALPMLDAKARHNRPLPNMQ